MKTIQIELPEAIEEQLNSMSQDQQNFIVEAIKEKIEKKTIIETDTQSLTESLIEGYQATYKEDLGLTSDFESVDFEDWK